MATIDISQGSLEIYGISIASLLDGYNDISGIFITYISNNNIIIATSNATLAISDQSTSIEDGKGKYFEKTIDSEDSYIIFSLLSNGQYYIDTEVNPLDSILYKLATPNDYIPSPPISGTSYTPTSTETYSLTISPESKPILFQQVVAQDISGIPPKLSDYPILRVLKAFNNDAVMSPAFNNLKVYETITEDIKAQSQTLEDGTTIRPQFKSYNAYLAYKNSLNNRNYVRKNP